MREFSGYSCDWCGCPMAPSSFLQGMVIGEKYYAVHDGCQYAYINFPHMFGAKFIVELYNRMLL